MKKKILGIFVCMLMILTVVSITVNSRDNKIDYQIFNSIKNYDDCGCGLTNNIGYKHILMKEMSESTDFDEDSSKPTIVETPDYFNWMDYEEQDWTTPTKNQWWPYPCGCCSIFAALGALDSIINIREGIAELDVDLSEQYVLSCLPRTGGCVYGSVPYNTFYYIMSDKPSGNNCNGIIPESCFPYRGIDAEGRDFFVYNHNPVFCDEKCEDWEEYLIPISDFGYWYPDGTSEDIDVIKTQVMEYGPVATSMIVTFWIHGEDNFYDWGWEHHDSDEYYSTSDQFDYCNHAVTIVGWKDDPSIDNGGYWVCKNTWGPEWGYNGFFNIEYGHLNIDSFEIAWVDYNPNVFVNWAPVANAGNNVYGDIGEELLFDGSGSFDHEGEIVSFEWDFGDGNTESGETTTHTYNSKGIYSVTLTINDNEGNTKNDTIWAFIEKSNEPPETPTIDGPLQGKKGNEYEYTFSAIDPDSDNLYYFISWGDLYCDSWIGPYTSGEEVSINHSWKDQATFNLRVKVKDCYDLESDWAIQEVSMPKNKPFNSHLNILNWLFERFPHAIPLLKYLYRIALDRNVEQSIFWR